MISLHDFTLDLIVNASLHLNYCRKEPSIHLMGRPTAEPMFVSHFSMLFVWTYSFSSPVTKAELKFRLSLVLRLGLRFGLRNSNWFLCFEWLALLSFHTTKLAELHVWYSLLPSVCQLKMWRSFQMTVMALAMCSWLAEVMMSRHLKSRYWKEPTLV